MTLSARPHICVPERKNRDRISVACVKRITNLAVILRMFIPSRIADLIYRKPVKQKNLRRMSSDSHLGPILAFK